MKKSFQSVITVHLGGEEAWASGLEGVEESW